MGRVLACGSDGWMWCTVGMLTAHVDGLSRLRSMEFALVGCGAGVVELCGVGLWIDGLVCA